ncbi:MAG: type I methionyl aminopeptidase [Oscillospiraceae bacterium]|jgi:methionyl aminopeptidase|nr:type I methionyl aminopeptidase [Oscillospiraceae bacterium]
MIIVKSPKEIPIMLKACEISALALKHAGSLVRPGVSTWEIDKSLGNFIKSMGAKPSFKGLYGFPGNACISVNEELIHGIPSKKRILREGDIVSVDVGAFKDGYHGDNTATFAVGEISGKARRLLEVTEQSLYEGIKRAVSGNRVGDISGAIQGYCESRGYFVPEEYFGHGVGRDLHEEPNVPNVGKPGRGPRLTPGMTLAIEPMINSTTARTRTLSDNWTVVEANGNLSAHFEHTVLITSGEPLVMTMVEHGG